MASDAREGSTLNASSADAPLQARVRRRARKRRGPPQLQFVTATDPSEFKGENAKRSVRSQAMIQYRYQSAEQRKKHGGDKGGGLTPTAERVVPIPQTDLAYAAAQNALLAQWQPASQPQMYSTTSEAWWNTQGQHLAEVPCSSRYAHALTTVPLNMAAKRVLESHDPDTKDAMLLHLLSRGLATTCVGSNLDPFSVIPQFASPELNSVSLVRSCNRIFVSKQTMARWVPFMLSDPHILLSSTIMSSTWRDKHEGVSGESRRTIILKAEIISWINERLRNAKTRLEDTTIMVIIHLLVGETWSCNEKTLHIHMSGLVKLLAARGSQGQPMVSDAIGLVATVVCMHVSIICESTPPSRFHRHQAPDFPVDESMTLPESPLYCPREEMYSVINDPACSGHTYELLCDVRDLTELFLAYSADLITVLETESKVMDSRLRTLSVDYDTKVAKIRAKLAALPSAYTPGLPTTHDWVYEVCRLTAIIHTSAIITCVPFSVAADPALNAVIRSAPCISGGGVSKRLTESLYEVLERTNTGDVWNNMAGVFYWVCAVGSAAARTPVTVNSYSRPSSQSEAYATWVRRCITMFSSRTLALMTFEHPVPLLAAQRKLLRIQELIGRGGSRA